MVLLMDTLVADSCLKEKHVWLFELLAELALFHKNLILLKRKIDIER